LIIHEIRVLLKDVVALGPSCVLQLKDRLWVKEVWFTIATPLVFTTDRELLRSRNFAHWWISDVMALDGLFGEGVERYSTKT
jgi:hypothetical protein